MYEPQEDSLMLKEVITTYLSKNPCKLCADIGTGTGIQGLAMKNYCKKIICTDINPDAIDYVSNIVKDSNFEVFESDLFINFDSSYKGKIDLVVFNPPYLPREENEEDDSDLTSGTSGLEVVIRFLIQSKDFLSKKGRIFFVASSASNINNLNDFLKEQGFNFKIVKKNHFFFEDIMIYEAWLNE